MTIRIRLFSCLRADAGADELELELADGATVSDALGSLRRTGPLVEVLARVPVVMAVNRSYADDHTPLAADDEIALIPPVSGGAR